MRARETTTARPDCNGYFPLFDYFSDQTDSVKLGPSAADIASLFNMQTCQTLLGLLVALPLIRSEAPDIRSIKPDLVIPKLESGQPKGGKRFKEKIPEYEKLEQYINSKGYSKITHFVEEICFII